MDPDARGKGRRAAITNIFEIFFSDAAQHERCIFLSCFDRGGLVSSPECRGDHVVTARVLERSRAVYGVAQGLRISNPMEEDGGTVDPSARG